jgi:hypothetical protein
MAEHQKQKYVFSVTYEQSDQSDIAQVVEDTMQAGMLPRAVIAMVILPLSIVLPLIATITKTGTMATFHSAYDYAIKEYRDGPLLAFALAVGTVIAPYLCWYLVLRWSVDPIYWKWTRRFWLRQGTTIGIALSDSEITISNSRTTASISPKWSDLKSVAKRSAGIVIRIKNGVSSVLAQPVGPVRAAWIFGNPYIWLPTRLFVNLDAQDELFDFLRARLPSGSDELPTFYSKPAISGPVFVLSFALCILLPAQMKLNLDSIRNPSVQFEKGLLYLNGMGVKQDTAKAVQFFHRAADKGFAKAQTELGNLYLIGRGVPKDDVLAVAWYVKAAEQHDDIARNNAAVLFIKGRAGSITESQVRPWIISSFGPHNLGVAFKQGWVLQQSDWEGDMFLSRAITQGDAAPANILELYSLDGQPLPSL